LGADGALLRDRPFEFRGGISSFILAAARGRVHLSS